MKIDLTWSFAHPDAVSNTIKYARIDNISSPVFTTITGVVSSPYTVENIDNGQYRFIGISVYADGRVCNETTADTAACPNIISLNATQSGDNIIITYVAPGDAPQVRAIVNFPNGGVFDQTYTNGSSSSTIIVPIPSGLSGSYTVYMQSVCDPDTAFYSALTGPVTVEVNLVTVQMTSTAVGIVVTSVTGLTGFTMSGSLSPGGSITGTHDTFTGAIGIVFTGTPSFDENVSLYVNSVFVECKNIPNTSGGTALFTSRTFYASDVILISFGLGAC